MSIIDSGLVLMAVGMTSVFVFLCMMIAMMYGINWISRRFTPEIAAGPDYGHIAAISAAVHRHMRDK